MHRQSLACPAAAPDSSIAGTEFTGLRFVLSPPVSSLRQSSSQIRIRTSLPTVIVIVTLRGAHRINDIAPMSQFCIINEVALVYGGEQAKKLLASVF